MVKLKKTVVKSIEIEEWRCDVCGETRSMGCSKHKCNICGCDVCDSCSHESDEYEYIRYCPTCWEVGESYRKILEITREEYYIRVNAIEKQWKEEVDRRRGKK